MVRLPCLPSRISATAESRAERLCIRSSVAATSRVAAAVGLMPRPSGTNRVRPVSRASAVMCWLTVDGV